MGGSASINPALYSRTSAASRLSMRSSPLTSAASGQPSAAISAALRWRMSAASMASTRQAPDAARRALARGEVSVTDYTRRRFQGGG
jgi:hypothetical protein